MKRLSFLLIGLLFSASLTYAAELRIITEIPRR